jgi:hypothetical protein
VRSPVSFDTAKTAGTPSSGAARIAVAFSGAGNVVRTMPESSSMTMNLGSASSFSPRTMAIRSSASTVSAFAEANGPASIASVPLSGSSTLSVPEPKSTTTAGASGCGAAASTLSSSVV